MSICARILHQVFKIGDRKKNSFFFRTILGMQVMRHEEFNEGCEAECNGPYDNRWGKTMLGYGPESTHFAIELTYNYGVSSYELGNDFGGITIKSKEVLSRAKENNCTIEQENGLNLLRSPDGYKFFILDEAQPTETDPILKVTLNCTDIKKSKEYWHGILNMKILEETEKSISLSYGDKQTTVEIKEISEPFNRAKAYGRTAFAVPYEIQPIIDEKIKNISGKILIPLTVLDTPGKQSVRVIILADPDGHEICFVEEDGYSKLSTFDPESPGYLDKNIEKDPFQKKE